MEAILIWLGSGFAFGVGVVCGIAIFKIASGNSARDEEFAKNQAKTLELLEQRNEIGRRQIDAMEEIAAAMNPD